MLKAKKLFKNIQKALQRWGNSVVVSGKRNKPYRRQSGNLDKSQKADVQGLGVNIHINPMLVTTDRGFNYGAHLHDKDPWMQEEVDRRVKEITDEVADLIVEAFV